MATFDSKADAKALKLLPHCKESWGDNCFFEKVTQEGPVNVERSFFYEELEGRARYAVSFASEIKHLMALD